MSSLKKIEAIIRPFKLEEVKEALVEEGHLLKKVYGV